MANTHCDVPVREFRKLDNWLRSRQENNGETFERLCRNLRHARATELTPRQAKVLQLYFDEEKTMTQIAQELGVSVSTVSRTIARAEQRLQRCLRYIL